MVDWKLLAPIIGTLLSGSILLSSIGFFYSEFINQPNIIIRVLDPQDENGQGIIELSNLGWNPANKFEMQIVAPKNVSTTRVESSENITTLQNDNEPRIIKVSTPRFVHGEGSVSKIFLELDTNDSNIITEKDYNIYSTFDEGSSIILHRPTQGEGYGFYDYFYNNLPPEYYKSFLGGGIRNLVVWTLFFSSFVILFLYFLYLFTARRKRTSFVNKIHKQIRIVGMKLSDNREYMEVFRDNSDPTIHGKKVELEASKYGLDTQLYRHSSRWQWIHNWRLPRYSIWDLWYVESDDFKTRAFPLVQYENIHKFFTLLTEREVLISFKMDLSQIHKTTLSKLEAEKGDYDSLWVFSVNNPFDKPRERYKKKIMNILRSYIDRVGDSKLRMISNSLDGKKLDLISRSPDIKEAAARSPDIKEAAARSPDIKEAAARSPDIKEAAARSPDIKEAAARSPDIKEAAARSPDIKEAAARSPDIKEAAAEPVAKKTRLESEINDLESLWEALAVITESEVTNAIKEKNTAIVKKFGLITNLEITEGSQESALPDYIK